MLSDKYQGSDQPEKRQRIDVDENPKALVRRLYNMWKEGSGHPYDRAVAILEEPMKGRTTIIDMVTELEECPEEERGYFISAMHNTSAVQFFAPPFVYKHTAYRLGDNKHFLLREMQDTITFGDIEVGNENEGIIHVDMYHGVRVSNGSGLVVINGSVGEVELDHSTGVFINDGSVSTLMKCSDDSDAILVNLKKIHDAQSRKELQKQVINYGRIELSSGDPLLCNMGTHLYRVYDGAIGYKRFMVEPEVGSDLDQQLRGEGQLLIDRLLPLMQVERVTSPTVECGLFEINEGVSNFPGKEIIEVVRSTAKKMQQCRRQHAPKW